MEFGIVELSRLQFAVTVMYHFLFVPLTLGLSILVAIMETVYVMTNRPIWRQMTKFWGLLFGINFALGVATGITMEFQFGMNWSYYSHYVGDIFGAPLAIEGLMAFFLEATFVGLFFFGWDKLSKVAHLIVAWLVAIGSNFSALWILIANGWMQNPVGAQFNPMTMRMEMTDFFAVLFNEVAQAKFVHTVSAGYVTAHSQKMKLAAIEGMWETEPAPAAFTAFGFPDQEARETHYAIHIPYVMGLIGTRSLTTSIPGIEELERQAETRIRSGMIAYDALMHIREERDNADPAETARFEAHSVDLGFAFLLKKYVDDPREATPEQIVQAANDTIPTVWPLFWSFRIMVALGFGFIATMGYFFWRASFKGMNFPRPALHLAVWMIPAPWIAAELGWFVAEYGRQPWTVDGVLPTAMSVSALSMTEVAITLAGFVIFYTVLFVIEMGLMLKYIRKGPFQDVEETEAWVARHTERLAGRRNADAIAMPAE